MRSALPAELRSAPLALAVLLPLTALLAFRLLWVGPESDRLAMRRAELDQQRVELAAARRAAVRLPQVEAGVERLRGRFETLRRALPAGREASALLRGLQGVAARSGLTVESFTLDATEPQEGYEARSVRLALTGGFHALAAFLTEVSRLPRIVAIGRLSIRPLPSGAPGAAPSGTIAATCVATTYVLQEPGGGNDATGGGESLDP